MPLSLLSLTRFARPGEARCFLLRCQSSRLPGRHLRGCTFFQLHLPEGGAITFKNPTFIACAMGSCVHRGRLQKFPGACAAGDRQRAQARAGLSAPRDSQAGAVSMAWDSTSWPKRVAQTVPFPDRAFLLSCVLSVGRSIARRISKMKSSEMLLSRPPNVL